jgi:hypothetical protein
MKERSITEKEVETCLNDHEISYPNDDDDDCMNYVYTFPTGRKIRVVVNERRPNHKIIVSVME